MSGSDDSRSDASSSGPTPDPAIALVAVDGAPTGDRIDSEAWAQLRDASDPDSYTQAWLDIQCKLTSGIVQGVVLLGSADTGPFSPKATWPQGSKPSPALLAVTETAITDRHQVTHGHRFRDASRRAGHDAVAHPLMVDGQLCGVIALEVSHTTDGELKRILEELEWGASWLEILVRRRTLTTKDRLVSVLDLLATTVQYNRFQAAATAVATELAGILRCERVAIGFLRGKHVRLKALSHSASFAKKANLVRALEAGMEEAVDQQATIVYPPVEDGPFQVVREHDTLCNEHGAESVCTIPFSEGQRLLGAIVLERPSGEPFDRETVQFCEHAASLLGPVLDVKRRDDRWLIQKALSSTKALIGRIIGPRNIALKLASIALVGLIVFFVFAEGDYRITADATLEGTVQRAVAAPMRGFVSQADARAGDIVREGQVLVTLDERDLRLERLKWTSQKAQRTNEYQEALAAHDRAKLRVLGAQIRQADAQIALIDEQLSRARIVAPFDGIVVAGDLSQSLGAPVERGDVMFQVAPLNTYRIMLEVDEREIGPVQVGQRGELALASMPHATLAMKVENITPVSNAEEGANRFRVEASLETEDLTGLRPGMEGVGKIYVDQRKLAWIWSHKIIHWVRLFIWRWWP